MKKVNTIEGSVAKLNTGLGVKVSGLDSKLDAILESLSVVNTSGPTIVECEAQLDHFISLQLKHTIEEVEKKYDASIITCIPLPRC